MSKPIQSAVEKVLSAHAEKLADAQAAADQRAAQVAAEIAASQAKLQPIQDSVRELANQLSELTTRRDAAIERIRIGRMQVEQQRAFVAELDNVAERIFGHTNQPSGAPTAHESFLYLENHRHLKLAPVMLPRYDALLELAEADLANIEAQILATGKEHAN